MKGEESESLGVTSARLLSSLYAGQLLGIVITVITFIVVARLLGPSGYGVYTFAFGFMMLVDFAGNFGIGTFFGKNLPVFRHEKKHQRVVDTLVTGYAILLPVTAFLTVLGIALSPFVAGVLFKQLDIAPITLMLASSLIFFSTTESTAVQALIGFTRGKLASVVSVSVDAVQLAACVLLVVTGHGVDGAIEGMLIGYVFGAVLALYFAFRIISKEAGTRIRLPTREERSDAVRYVIPMSLNNLLNFSMASFATLYLSLFVTKAILGNYGASLRGLNFIAVFYSTMSTALLPLFATAGVSRKPGEVNKTYNRIFYYSLMTTLPFIVFVAVLARPGISLLLSTGYENAGLYLSLIAFGSMIDAFQYYISVLLISKGFTMPLVRTLLISNALQLATVLMLAPRFGVVGAIVGLFFVGPLIESALFVRLSSKLMGFELEARRVIALYACNLLLAVPLAAALLLSSSVASLVAGLVILVVAYPALLVLLGLMRRPDIEMISGISKKIPILDRPASIMVRYFAFLLSLRPGQSA